jgi:sugar O-acyltransferase (sialic acid O-acetyltransferase NeuD family)
MNASLVIFGAGGHALSVANVAVSCGLTVVAFVDNNQSGSEIMGIPVISPEKCFGGRSHQDIAIAIGDNVVRERVYNEILIKMPSAVFPTLVHSSSVIGIGASVGAGAVVMPLVNVGPKSKIGGFCVLNSCCSVDHDSTLEAFSSIAPGAVCGGNVYVGFRSAVSMGAKVKQGVSIGNDVVIGANSYVNNPVEDNVVAFGTPCKVIRKRSISDSYLT